MQNHLEKLGNHTLAKNILPFWETIHKKLMARTLLFLDIKYKDLLENH